MKAARNSALAQKRNYAILLCVILAPFCEKGPEFDSPDRVRSAFGGKWNHPKWRTGIIFRTKRCEESKYYGTKSESKSES